MSLYSHTSNATTRPHKYEEVACLVVNLLSGSSMFERAWKMTWLSLLILTLFETALKAELCVPGWKVIQILFNFNHLTVSFSPPPQKNLTNCTFKALMKSMLVSMSSCSDLLIWPCVCVRVDFQWLHPYHMSQLIPFAFCVEMSVIAYINIQLKCARPSTSLSDGVGNLIKVSHAALQCTVPSPGHWEMDRDGKGGKKNKIKELMKRSGRFTLFCFFCSSTCYSAGN